jgi:hypothetical protein
MTTGVGYGRGAEGRQARRVFHFVRGHRSSAPLRNGATSRFLSPRLSAPLGMTGMGGAGRKDWGGARGRGARIAPPFQSPQSSFRPPEHPLYHSVRFAGIQPKAQAAERREKKRPARFVMQRRRASGFRSRSTTCGNDGYIIPRLQVWRAGMTKGVGYGRGAIGRRVRCAFHLRHSSHLRHFGSAPHIPVIPACQTCNRGRA